MASEISFKTEGGQPAEQLIADLEKALQPTVGDLLYAGQRQRSRILKRTQEHVDVDGNAFTPYSTKRPYYWNPTGGKKGLTLSQRIAATQRIMRKLSGSKGYTKVARDGGRIIAEVRGHGDTIRFPHYAAFKQYLGRDGVDLRGPRAPHMLQAIIVRVRNYISTLTGFDGGFAGVSDNSQPEPADEIRIGIYGPEAGRASAHNEGTGHMPKRKFIGASQTDKTDMTRDIMDRVMHRVKRVLKGRK